MALWAKTRSTDKQAVGHWNYLRPRPESSRKQLYVKNTRLPASIVWRTTLREGETREQAARNWGLTPGVVDEIVRYCEANEELINAEFDHEWRDAEKAGLKLDPPPVR